jgi:formylglycine-generating enzyme required for sulfatase activity
LLEVIHPAEFLELEMVLIPAGRFLMGSVPGLGQAARTDEYPQHSLYLPDYYMAKTPVTKAQYAVFVQATGYRQPTRRLVRFSLVQKQRDRISGGDRPALTSGHRTAGLSFAPIAAAEILGK